MTAKLTPGFRNAHDLLFAPSTPEGCSAARLTEIAIYAIRPEARPNAGRIKAALSHNLIVLTDTPNERNAPVHAARFVGKGTQVKTASGWRYPLRVWTQTPETRKEEKP